MLILRREYGRIMKKYISNNLIEQKYINELVLKDNKWTYYMDSIDVIKKKEKVPNQT